MPRIRNLNNILVGGLLIAVALLALALTNKLAVGSATSMGPGYVPRLLCFIQIAFGIGIALQGMMFEDAPFEAWAFRPLAWILVSIGFFALTVERLGLALSVFGLVVLSAIAHRQVKWTQTIALAVFMAVFAVGAFVMLLGLTVLVWPAALVR